MVTINQLAEMAMEIVGKKLSMNHILGPLGVRGRNSDPVEDIASGMLDILEYKGIIVKEKKIVRRTLTLWRDNKLDIVDCYLIACLEGDKQNILYSYDCDFDKFDIDRKEP